jgi:hypothetical protein
VLVIDITAHVTNASRQYVMIAKKLFGDLEQVLWFFVGIAPLKIDVSK